MATTIQDEIYSNFLKVAGQQASGLSDVTMTLADVLAQLNEMRAGGTSPSAKVPAAAPASQANSGGDVLSSVASTVLKSGFGLAPLIGGLVSLFGGGAPDTPPPLVKYALPPGIDFQATETGSGVSGLDYDQNGMPRASAASSTSSTQTPSSGQTTSVAGSEANTAGGAPARQAPQITVNVQAMDARSFLDRSNEIALAVRDAMLNMNAINDVVNEL